MDLRGLLPESWCCVDCGFNTAPGLSTRAEAEAAFAAGQDGIEQTYDDRSEVYTVRDAVWKAAGMKPWGGCLCIGCLEQRLGRRLKPRDFLRGHVFNNLPGTQRLRDRRWEPPQW
jgi:hypothetical protein